VRLSRATSDASHHALPRARDGISTVIAFGDLGSLPRRRSRSGRAETRRAAGQIRMTPPFAERDQYVTVTVIVSV
jgi:hypothetical protein